MGYRVSEFRKHGVGGTLQDAYVCRYLTGTCPLLLSGMQGMISRRSTCFCTYPQGEGTLAFLVLGPYSEFLAPGSRELLELDPVQLLPYLLFDPLDLLLRIDGLLVREFQY